MLREKKRTLILSSLLTLSPILIGLLLWSKLPEQLTTHWGGDGVADGWSGRPFAVFGLPLLMLAIHWVCVLGTSADPKKNNHPGKVVHLVLWIVPVLSVVLHAVTYAAALGKEVRMELVMPIVVGLVLAIVGNYLPKCKQNYTIGIKIPWTLNSEENWNKTHRFAGRLWVVCGIVIILTGFFGGFWIFLGIALLMVIAPFLYSYILYRKGV